MNKNYLKLQNTWQDESTPNPNDLINLYCIDGDDIRCVICPEGNETIPCKLNKLCAAQDLQGDADKCQGGSSGKGVGGVLDLCSYISGMCVNDPSQKSSGEPACNEPSKQQCQNIEGCKWQDSLCEPTATCMYQGWPKNSLLDQSNEKQICAPLKYMLNNTNKPETAVNEIPISKTGLKCGPEGEGQLVYIPYYENDEGKSCAYMPNSNVKYTLNKVNKANLVNSNYCKYTTGGVGPGGAECGGLNDWTNILPAPPGSTLPPLQNQHKSQPQNQQKSQPQNQHKSQHKSQ